LFSGSLVGTRYDINIAVWLVVSVAGSAKPESAMQLRGGNKKKHGLCGYSMRLKIINK
jgi:hypothetical protein